METVQKFMPYFQEMLQQWYQLTLHNQEYAIALVGSACLITAIFYSIRIAFLKRGAAKILKAKQETQAGLDEANQQLEALRQQLAEATEHQLAAEKATEAESHKAANLELRLNKSNQQLAGSLVNLVDCFELNLHNLPTADADNLLSEHEAVIARVADRFQNEQQAKTQLQLSMHAETAKLAEKEMLISSLENRLDTQTQHLAKLELAVEKYEAAQKQLEQDKLQLALELQNRQAAAAGQQTYAKQPAVAPVVQAPVPAPVEKAPEPIKPAENLVSLPETKQEPTPVPVKPQAAVSETVKAPVVEKTKPATANKKKGLFGRVMDKVAKMDEKLGSPSNVANAEPDAAEVIETQPESSDRVEHTESVEPVAQVESAKPHSGFNDKLSGLFGGFKKPAAKSANLEPEQETATPAAEQAPVAAEKPDAGKDKKVSAQFSGLFGKFKAKK